MKRDDRERIARMSRQAGRTTNLLFGRDCPACDGYGHFTTPRWKRCMECGGTGKRSKTVRDLVEASEGRVYQLMQDLEAA